LSTRSRGGPGAPQHPSAGRIAEEIQALHDRYNIAADNVDLDAFTDCFTTDALFEFAQESLQLCGVVELAAFLSGSSQQGFHASWVIDIEVVGEGIALTTARLEETNRRSGEVFRTGMYADELKRVDGRWQFARRRLTYDFGELGRPS
jgi:predicted acyl esterase